MNEETDVMIEIQPLTAETMLYKFLFVPGEFMLNSMGLPFDDGTKCNECTEVWIQGLTNFERVQQEHDTKRALRSYSFYESKNQWIPVLDKGGPILAGDYIVRSSIQGYFEKGSVQNYSARPYGISVNACTFQPAMIPVYQNKKILKTITVEKPVQISKTIRKYKLQKEWTENGQGQGQWIGQLEPSTIEIMEPMYRSENIYDTNGTIIDTFQVPVTETVLEIREEDEVDENGNIVQEQICERLEYQLHYINDQGMFEPEYRPGLYKMHYVQVDVLNYCF